MSIIMFHLSGCVIYCIFSKISMDSDMFVDDGRPPVVLLEEDVMFQQQNATGGGVFWYKSSASTTTETTADDLYNNIAADDDASLYIGSREADDVMSDEQTMLSGLERFSVAYQDVHGYVSLGVCSFGIVSNALNVVVFTRRSMMNATNCLLTALAVTDLLTMLVYVPYAVYFYCIAQPDPTFGHRYMWIVYLLLNSSFSITAHTVAVWLTVSVAVFRYIVVCGRHSIGARLCNRRRAYVAIVAVVVTTVVFCIPHYIRYHPDAPVELFEVAGQVVNSTSGNTTITTTTTLAYWFTERSFITAKYRNVTFWLYGVVLKVVPCIVLTTLSGLLVRAMRMADVRRRRLLNAGRRAESNRAGEHNRTTAMLVAVVLCFVATELPHGVLAFLSGINDRIFYTVYIPLGDIWDILVLANSAVNFVVYCKMNRRFRRAVVDGMFRVVGRVNGDMSVGGGDGATELMTAAVGGGGGGCGGVSLMPTTTQLHRSSMLPSYCLTEPK